MTSSGTLVRMDDANDPSNPSEGVAAPMPPRQGGQRLGWLRPTRSDRSTVRPATSPKEIRWWVGVVWLVVSALLIGFVVHVTLVGILQHARAQFGLYQELRTELALATAPLGQLDVNNVLVPDGTAIGLITIERLGISEVFVQGSTSGVLTAGPGHRRDTVMPGQLGTSIVMGRQATFGGPFGSLWQAVPGDEIEVITGQGTSTYSVLSVRQAGDPLPVPLAAGEGRLELITADGIPLAPSGTLHVDANLVSTPFETPSPVFTTAVLDPAEFAMAANPGQWFMAFFWLQWLVIGALALRWVRSRWGQWQTWIIAVPILLALGAAFSGAVATILPNLL